MSVNLLIELDIHRRNFFWNYEYQSEIYFEIMNLFPLYV